MVKRFDLKKFIKGDSGQSVVELAITIPVLLLLLCGIIEFAWIMSGKMIITHIGRDAARYGAVNAEQIDSVSEIEQRILDAAPGYLKDRITISITYTNIYDIRAGDVEVKITCRLNALTPIAGMIYDSQDITIDAESIMKVE